MISYILLFFFLVFLFFLSESTITSSNKLGFYIIVATSLIFFAGFRNPGVGADDLSYVIKFLEIPDLSHWFNGDYTYSFKTAWMEPLYIFLGAVVKLFTTHPSILFLIVAFLSVGLSAYYYQQLSIYPSLSLILYFSHTFLYRDMNQIRAGIAASIGLGLIPLLQKRNHVLIIFTIIIASLFHMAALCFFIPYTLSFFNLTRKRLIFGFILAFIAGSIGITPIMLQLLPNAGYITIKLMNYSKSEYAEPLGLFDFTNIKNMGVLLFTLYFWNELKCKLKYFNELVLFTFIATSWRVAFCDFGIFAGRISTFFSIAEVILLPGFLLIFKQKNIAAILIIIYATLMLCLNLFFKSAFAPYSLLF